MCAEPPSTRLDLRFRLAGVGVRVHPVFWLVSALLGLRLPIAEHLLWIAVVFVSLLLHEMGHALSARFAGGQSRVVLYGLGGMTLWDPGATTLGWHSGLVAFSGLLAGSVLALAVYVLLPFAGPTHSGFLGALYFHLLSVNVVWTLLNVLPIYPLDGGHAMQGLLMRAGGDIGYGVSSIVSVVSAGIVAFVAWRMSQPLFAMFMAFLAVKEWQRSF